MLEKWVLTAIPEYPSYKTWINRMNYLQYNWLLTPKHLGLILIMYNFQFSNLDQNTCLNIFILIKYYWQLKLISLK